MLNLDKNKRYNLKYLSDEQIKEVEDSISSLYSEGARVEILEKSTLYFDKFLNEWNVRNDVNYTCDALEWLNNNVDYKLKTSFDEVFNPQPHYDNSKGSLYKVGTERGWGPYLFDVVKRLERGGKKDPLKQEIQKSIDVLKIWLNEIEDKI